MAWECRNQNTKIDSLLEEYSNIKMNTTDNQKAINDFIDWVIEIKEFLCELLEAMYE